VKRHVVVAKQAGCDGAEDLSQMLGPLPDVSPACLEAYEVRGADLGEVVEEIGIVELNAGRSGRIGGARPADRAGARIVDSGVRDARHRPPPVQGQALRIGPLLRAGN
jgi:hypothetical protein